MIEFNVKIGNRKIEVKSPTNWNELTLAQLVRIEKEFRPNPDNFILLFNILTGLDIDFIENSKDDKLEQTLYKICSFIAEEIDFQNLEAPAYIIIGSENVMVPKDFGRLSLGQKMMIAQNLEGVDDLVNNCHIILANIFQPIIDGKYKRERVESLSETIKESNGLDGYAVAKSFFLRSSILKRVGIKNLKVSQAPQASRRLRSAKWLKVIDWTDLQT